VSNEPDLTGLIALADRRREAPARQESKQCAGCGEDTYRQGGETPTAFRRRKYCTPACYNAHRIKAPARKPCEHCGAQMERDVAGNESVAHFNRRRFCTKQCYHAQRGAVKASLAAERRMCLGCGEHLVPRYGEGVAAFAARKSCKLACQAKRRSYVVEEVDFLVGSDEPDRLARRLGYELEGLVSLLEDEGREDLARRLGVGASVAVCAA